MYGMTPIGVFFLAVFPPRPPNQGFCQQLQSVQRLSACHKILQGVFHPIQTIQQLLSNGREPKGGNKKRQHQSSNTARMQPREKGAGRQQDKYRTRKAAARARDAGKEREHRHNEHHRQDKGSRDDF